LKRRKDELEKIEIERKEKLKERHKVIKERQAQLKRPKKSKKSSNFAGN